MSYILLTRPLDDAIEIEKKLHVPVVKAPLLQVELIPQKTDSFAAHYTSLIVTSARSLLIFSEVPSFLKKPIWCVGNKTATMAKKLGFETIYSAKNSAEELCQMIMEKTKSEAEKFLHICGETLHYDIVENLQKNGYQAEKCVLYKTIPITYFSEEILKLFFSHQISIIPMFSRKTAETLAKVLQFHKLEPYLKNITLVSCAEQIVKPLQKFKWNQVIIKSDLSVPTLEAIYRGLEKGWGGEMPQKKLWALLGGTVAVSLVLSLACFSLVAPHVISMPKPLDVEKIQQTIMDALKAQQLENLTGKESKINDLASQVTVLKQEVDNLRQQPNIEKKEVITSLDNHLKAFIVVGQVEEQLKSAKIDPLWWEELKKLLLQARINLPEGMFNLKEMPATKQELLLDLRKLIAEKPVGIVTSPNSQKIQHPWLEKVEQYIGQIVIHKTESSSSLPDLTDTDEQTIQAIERDDRTKIKTLITNKEITDQVKVILEKADERLSILEELKRIKPLLLQLTTEDKE